MRTATPSIDLETPLRVIERERRQLTDEHRAFERFSARVATLETATPQLVGNSAPHVADPASPGLEAVQEAYAETVMSVSHYEGVYDEPWYENMAEEFSDELAAAVEGTRQLHPQLKRSIVDAATQAANNRTQLLERIESEREALKDANRAIATSLEELNSLLDQPAQQLEFNTLRLTRERLLTLRKRCDALARKRQAQIQRRRGRLTIADVGAFEGYLYDECENTYPVLAGIAELGAGIDQVLTAVDRALTRTE